MTKTSSNAPASFVNKRSRRHAAPPSYLDLCDPRLLFCWPESSLLGDEQEALGILDSALNPANTDIGPTPLDSQPTGFTGLFQAPAPRGLITTREGIPIAFSKTGQRLYIRLAELASTPDEAVAVVEEICDSLRARAPSLDPPGAREIQTHFTHRRVLPLAVSGVLSHFEIERLGQQLPGGCLLRTVYTREYPHGASFAHLTGYIGSSMPDQHGPIGVDDYLWPPLVGRAGLEKTLEAELTGSAGTISQLFDDEGRLLNREIAQAPRPGLTVMTTLNFRMQKLAERELEKSGRPGAFVAMDAETGDVLALVSYPSYDPNEFIPGISETRYRELADHPEAPFFDRAVTGEYPPGSTFKPIVALAGLDSGTLDGPRTKYSGPPALWIDDREFKNWNKNHEGTLDVRFALSRSCNTWFYQAGFDMGSPAIGAMAEQFGFGRSARLPLEAVSAGHLPDCEVYSDRKSIANFAIGQGSLLASPLQMATAMAGLANGDFVPRPRLIRWKLDPITEAVVEEPRVEAQEWLCLDPEDLDPVYAGMYAVVNHGGGTARGAYMDKPRVYGKTGTAQWFVDGVERRLAWFVGWADSESPRIAFAAITQGRPGESLGGGRNAAPIAAEFLKEVYDDPELYAVVMPEQLLRPDPSLNHVSGETRGVTGDDRHQMAMADNESESSAKPRKGKGFFKGMFRKKVKPTE